MWALVYLHTDPGETRSSTSNKNSSWLAKQQNHRSSLSKSTSFVASSGDSAHSASRSRSLNEQQGPSNDSSSRPALTPCQQTPLSPSSRAAAAPASTITDGRPVQALVGLIFIRGSRYKQWALVPFSGGLEPPPPLVQGQLSRARVARGCNINFQGKLFTTCTFNFVCSLHHESPLPPPRGTK
ncbi:hypothetical protein MRX96_039933 [Rhipicephalus microplus]